MTPETNHEKPAKESLKERVFEDIGSTLEMDARYAWEMDGILRGLRRIRDDARKVRSSREAQKREEVLHRAVVEAVERILDGDDPKSDLDSRELNRNLRRELGVKKLTKESLYALVYTWINEDEIAAAPVTKAEAAVVEEAADYNALAKEHPGLAIQRRITGLDLLKEFNDNPQAERTVLLDMQDYYHQILRDNKIKDLKGLSPKGKYEIYRAVYSTLPTLFVRSRDEKSVRLVRVSEAEKLRDPNYTPVVPLLTNDRSRALTMDEVVARLDQYKGNVPVQLYVKDWMLSMSRVAQITGTPSIEFGTDYRRDDIAGFMGAFVKASGDAFSAVPGAIARMFYKPSDPEYDKWIGYEEFVKGLVPSQLEYMAEEAKDTNGAWLGQMLEQSMRTAAISGWGPIGPLVNSALGFAASSRDSYDETMASLEKNFPNLSKDEKVQLSRTVGGICGAFGLLEGVMGNGNVFSKVKGDKKFLIDRIRAVAMANKGKLVELIAWQNPVVRKLIMVGGDSAKNAIEEGLQEGLEQVVQNVSMKVVAGDPRGWSEGLWDAVLMGAAGGTVGYIYMKGAHYLKKRMARTDQVSPTQEYKEEPPLDTEELDALVHNTTDRELVVLLREYRDWVKDGEVEREPADKARVAEGARRSRENLLKAAQRVREQLEREKQKGIEYIRGIPMVPDNDLYNIYQSDFTLSPAIPPDMAALADFEQVLYDRLKEITEEEFFYRYIVQQGFLMNPSEIAVRKRALANAVHSLNNAIDALADLSRLNSIPPPTPDLIAQGKERPEYTAALEIFAQGLDRPGVSRIFLPLLGGILTDLTAVAERSKDPRILVVLNSMFVAKYENFKSTNHSTTSLENGSIGQPNLAQWRKDLALLRRMEGYPRIYEYGQTIVDQWGGSPNKEWSKMRDVFSTELRIAHEEIAVGNSPYIYNLTNDYPLMMPSERLRLHQFLSEWGRRSPDDPKLNETIGHLLLWEWEYKDRHTLEFALKKEERTDETGKTRLHETIDYTVTLDLGIDVAHFPALRLCVDSMRSRDIPDRVIVDIIHSHFLTKGLYEKKDDDGRIKHSQTERANNKGGPSLQEAMTKIYELETAMPGSVAYLHEHFGITHFERYPSEALLLQARLRQRLTAHQEPVEYVAVFSAYDDWNQAFKNGLIPLAFSQGKAAGVEVVFFEWKDKPQIARDFKSWNNLTSNTKPLGNIFGMHGWEYGGEMGGSRVNRMISTQQFQPSSTYQRRGQSVSGSQEAGRLVQQYLQPLFGDAPTVFWSCSTGKLDLEQAGASATYSSLTQSRTIAPVVPTNIKSLTITRDNSLRTRMISGIQSFVFHRETPTQLSIDVQFYADDKPANSEPSTVNKPANTKAKAIFEKGRRVDK